jgi:ankyrin repeat protein
MYGHLYFIEFLYFNIYVESFHQNGKAPLMDACERRNSEIVKILLENRADPNVAFPGFPV